MDGKTTSTTSNGFPSLDDRERETRAATGDGAKKAGAPGPKARTADPMCGFCDDRTVSPSVAKLGGGFNICIECQLVAQKAEKTPGLLRRRPHHNKHHRRHHHAKRDTPIVVAPLKKKKATTTSRRIRGTMTIGDRIDALANGFVRIESDMEGLAATSRIMIQEFNGLYAALSKRTDLRDALPTIEAPSIIPPQTVHRGAAVSASSDSASSSGDSSDSDSSSSDSSDESSGDSSDSMLVDKEPETHTPRQVKKAATDVVTTRLNALRKKLSKAREHSEKK